MTRVSDKHRHAELFGPVEQLDPVKLGINSGGAMSFANRVFEPYPGATEADSTQADDPLPDTDGPRVAFRKGKEAVIVAIGSPKRDVLIKHRSVWKDFRYLTLCSVYMVLFVGLLLFGLHYYGLWERMQTQQKQKAEEQMALRAQLLETKEQHLEWQRSENATWQEHIQVQRLLLEASARDNVTLNEQLNDTKIALEDCKKRAESLHGLYLHADEQRKDLVEEISQYRQRAREFMDEVGRRVNNLHARHADEKGTLKDHLQSKELELDNRAQRIRQLEIRVEELTETISVANTTRKEMSKLLEAKEQQIKGMEGNLGHIMRMMENMTRAFDENVQKHVQGQMMAHYVEQAQERQNMESQYRSLEQEMEQMVQAMHAKQRALDTMRAHCCRPGTTHEWCYPLQ